MNKKLRKCCHVVVSLCRILCLNNYLYILRNQYLLLIGLCACSQSCLTLCDPMDCSPPGSSVHGILQARTLQWVVMPSSRGSSQPRNQTRSSWVSCIGNRNALIQTKYFSVVSIRLINSTIKIVFNFQILSIVHIGRINRGTGIRKVPP